MEKNYGIELSELKKLLDQYIMKSGETIDEAQLREGLEHIVFENNKALMKDIEKMIDEKISLNGRA